MQLFYNKNLVPSDSIIEFDKNESRHIAKVLRHSIGDKLHVTNGKGFIFTIELTEVSHKCCSGTILEVEERSALPYHLHIAMAPTKSNDRFEWFLEKATELGISEITPIICDHSERKVIKHDRMSKIIEGAVKQSLSAYTPILNEAISLSSFLKNNSTNSGLKCIAHCYNQDKSPFFELIQEYNEILILIGPEGDFSLSEIAYAQNYGFRAVSLGKRRLRTETAGIFACSQVATIK